ncbi:hypothetical protein DFH09DRAFT_1336558 [Mycena vulgaris]|nr:hypothetical protein DFH09DRAFT_1336558 [Mycena vulgaris]
MTRLLGHIGSALSASFVRCVAQPRFPFPSLPPHLPFTLSALFSPGPNLSISHTPFSPRGRTIIPVSFHLESPRITRLPPSQLSARTILVLAPPPPPPCSSWPTAPFRRRLITHAPSPLTLISHPVLRPYPLSTSSSASYPPFHDD